MAKNYIKQQITTILHQLSQCHSNPQLMVATKYASLEETQAVINAGVSCIGENKVQDAVRKKNALTHLNVEWHMIGHLQKNKINKAIEVFDVIQSFDSISLLEKVNDALRRKGKTMTGFLQLNIGNDSNKHGFLYEEIKGGYQRLCSFSNISITGIMVVMPLACSDSELRRLFRKSYELFNYVKQHYSPLNVLSMGMSGDYKVALEEGSSMVRLGSIIFKEDC